MEQTTHQTVVEHTALETVHKRDEDGRIIDTYTVRMRWEDVVEEKRAVAPTLRSGKLERAKARYQGQPLDDTSGPFVLDDGAVVLLQGKEAHLAIHSRLMARAIVSIRAQKRATKRAKQTAGLPEVA